MMTREIQALVGQKIDDVEADIRQKYQNVRIYKFTEMVTADMQFNRLNVIYDNDRIIVDCKYG